MRLVLIAAVLLLALLLASCGLKEVELMCANDHRVYEKHDGIWIDTGTRCMPERAIQ